MAMARSDTRAVELKMATPRAGTNELGGSATAVRPAVGAGEEKLIRGTCWARSVRVTEKVTVTQREGVDGVTETCTAGHVETAEIVVETREVMGNEVTELAETREIEGELDGMKDEHTHIAVVEDNGGELAGCLETRCEQLDSLLQERGEGICPLEAIHDQVGPVELRGVEGASAANGCTESLGGI